MYMFAYNCANSLHGSNTGCNDMSCPGFVQVSKTIALGAIIQPISIYKGQQYELRLTLYQVKSTHLFDHFF